MKTTSLVRLGLAAAALAYVGLATAAFADTLPNEKAGAQLAQANAQQPCAPAAKAGAPTNLNQPAIGGYQRQSN